MGHWLHFFRCFNPSCGSDHGPAGTGVRGAQIRANQGGTSRVLAPRARGLCAGVTATMTAAFFPLVGAFMAMALTWLIMTVTQTNISSERSATSGCENEQPPAPWSVSAGGELGGSSGE